MKKVGALIFLFCIVVCIVCGCGNFEPDRTALDFVNLCNYTSLDIPKEKYIVSDEDISTAIQMHLSSLDIEASELSSDIAVKYFNCENATTAKEKIKKEIIENRFYEAACEKIFELSEIIEFPKSSDGYINKLVLIQEKYAKAEGLSLKEYLNNNYQVTEEEFREIALDGYAEYLILEAIALKEGYIISTECRNKQIEKISSEIGLSSEETLNLFGAEFFNTLIYEEFLRSLILETYEDFITEALKQ